MVHLLHRLAGWRGLIGKRDFGVGGDHLRHLVHSRDNGRVIVVGAQIRNHLPADVAHLAVGQNAFQTVSHIDPVFVVVHGQQHQRAAVRSLAAHLPLVFKLVGIVRRVISIQVVDGDNGDLCIGLGVVKLAAKAVEPRNRIR